MKPFMDDNFLLNSKTAINLYHNFAKDMPIYDYHCHLSAEEIATDKCYKNITEIWLGGDHYKWRALRSNGVSEEFITGNCDDKEKFMKWAETVPHCIGNPLYHWTHLELQRYFGIKETLSPKTAEMIWQKANEKLQGKTLTAKSLIEKSNVKVICTTDDPVDSLQFHKQIADNKSFTTKVLPTFRPDKAINIDLDWFVDWINELSDVVGYKISTLDDLLKALLERIDFFHEMGCRVSDHALDVVQYEDCSKAEADKIFNKGLKRESISAEELKKYKGFMMLFFGREYNKRDWAMQLHIGALRNNSARRLRELGPDTGFDSINDTVFAQDLAKLLNALDDTDELPKTILYVLNPRDNEVIGTIIGCFQSGGIAGKIQFGSGWWFNDQKDGMSRQLEALSQLGLLSRFIGMLTDSRSFLSYTRHEYFRRILCDKLGSLIENGEYPNDLPFVGEIVRNISFNNAKNYFSIEL